MCDSSGFGLMGSGQRGRCYADVLCPVAPKRPVLVVVVVCCLLSGETFHLLSDGVCMDLT